MAVSALVGAIGEGNTPLGRSLEAVVKASSLASALQSASTVSELAAVASIALELLPLDPRATSALAGMTTIAGLATQLVSAASASPPNITDAMLASISLVKELGAPRWVLRGLTKVVSVAEAAPRLVAAVAQPDVPAAVLTVVEMAAGVAGTEPWVTTALTSLIAGDVAGAYAVLSPQLQPAVLMNQLANLPQEVRSKLMLAAPKGGSSAGGNSPLAGIAMLCLLYTSPSPRD